MRTLVLSAHELVDSAAVQPELKFCHQSAEKKLLRTQVVRGGVVTEVSELASDKYRKDIMLTFVPKLRELHYLYTQKSRGRVVAHCLDLDIVTAANDIDEAEKRLDCLVIVHVEEALGIGNYAALNIAAPGSYWNTFNEAFRNGQIRKSNNPTLRFKMPDVVPLEQNLSSIGVLAAISAAA